MRKRVITLLVILAVMMCGIIPTSAAGFTDTVGKPSENAASLLAALGLVEGKAEGLYEPDANLTRAEMATIVMRVMGADVTASGADIFTDVPSSHWAYKNIAAAYNIGVVAGIDAKTFAPDAQVTYAQAVKMIVCALGYEVHAQSQGGYPTGYLSKASQLGILKGATQSSDTAITRGTMAIILANALDVKLLEKTSFGNDANQYKESKDTLLSKYLHIDKFEGIISGNYFTSIDGSRSIARDEILLDGKSYKVGTSNAGKLVGRKVAIYVQTPDGYIKPEVRAVVENSNVETITVNAEDILPKSTAGKLYYEDSESGKEKTVEISSTAKLIYNGSIKEGWTASDLQPETGVVTLVSNGVSTDYIFVDEYVSYIVSSTFADENKVYFKSTTLPEITIDIDDKSVRTEFTNADGSIAVIDDLEEWDVISITQSLDGKTLKAVRSSEKATGKVQEKSDDEVKINDVVYKVSKSFTEGVNVGDVAAYSLDFNGKIVGADTEYENDGKYGYLVGAAYSKGIDKYPEIKIFTEDGEMKIFQTSDKVEVGGVKVEKASLLGSPKLMNGEQVIRQLIKYRTNEDGTKITAIMTEGTGSYAIEKTMYIDKDRKVGTDTVLFIGGTLKMFATKYLIRDNTKIFVIPNDVTKDSDYLIKAPNTLTHGNDGDEYANVTLYDSNEDLVIGAMVWDRSSATDTGEATPTYPAYTADTAIVTDIVTGINADGEETKILKLFNWSGKEISVSVKNDFENLLFRVANTNADLDPAAKDETGKVVISDMKVGSTTYKGYKHRVKVDELNPGDVLQYTVDSSGEATMLNIVYRAQTPGDYEMQISTYRRSATTERNNYGSLLVGSGVVVKKTEYGVLTQTKKYNVSLVKAEPTITFERMYVFAGQMLEYDMDKKTMKKITADDFREGDRVLSIWRTNAQRMLIKYKNVNTDK